MLEQIRHYQRLRTVLFTVFALAWLAASLTGAQVRAALDARSTALFAKTVCFTDPASFSTAGLDLHPDEPHQHAPDCLLCTALATPPDEVPAYYRPPVPAEHSYCLTDTKPVAVWRAQAPLPARGPPAAHV